MKLANGTVTSLRASSGANVGITNTLLGMTKHEQGWGKLARWKFREPTTHGTGWA
ncbi:hypothetical protein GCM10009642_40180 [Nocardiopsis metallicus]